MATQAKSNEITTLPRLVKLLDLKGATVTVDAMHCQKKTASTLLDAQADYIMQAKANQRSVYDDVRLFFDEAIEHGCPRKHTGMRAGKPRYPGGPDRDTPLLEHVERGLAAKADQVAGASEHGVHRGDQAD